MLINKKRTCHLVDFAVPMDLRVKIEINKKIGKYIDLARELKKKLLSLNMTGVSSW